MISDKQYLRMIDIISGGNECTFGMYEVIQYCNKYKINHGEMWGKVWGEYLKQHGGGNLVQNKKISLWERILEKIKK